MRISRESLHVSISDPVSASMNFLNEVAGRFPDAVSLAAGRPYEGFYDVGDVHKYLDVYTDHLAAQGRSPEQVRGALMQYGRTNGQIHDLIARLLATDEGIDVPAEAVAVTAGCQEAMVIALRGLCAGPRDVLLAVEPCYVGITGAARLLGIEVVAVPESPDGVDPEAVAAVARAARERGLRPRAVYTVPNFSNPSGVSVSLAVRRRLLEVAAAEDLLILEDDPYGLFGLADAPTPSLKSLDTDQRVIYLGSFAKSVFPGARVGFLVADQEVVDAAGRRTLLATELSAIKSMLTVNTSPIAQAVIGGVLVESGFSLRTANRDKIAFYRRNLVTTLDALDRYFPEPARTERGIRWNVPDGGFFVVVDVPVLVNEELLEFSAREFGVLWTPMSFFYADGGHHALRLSCSWLSPTEIDEGVRRLAALIEHRLTT
ncbi:GntR family transcriptional regulator [Longispora fulva]|uniref:(S)-3,5-dihydroxyphenylglycine transaminase n=1 Tax=Longispora fulva TaxID=619741 RepID=A0A8J7GY73_9ACTN|nr:PLP-dependent aminotransferase family protein [Longispora fulva]MBG6141419.1 (S)-3,5-dihydroxyphenylglycine transaminase [Longispora fulva]GIG59431.1 GntR family transcriptional regulator [Longispora fulva]